MADAKPRRVKPVLPAYFMLRVVREGPLLPAKLWLDDAEPGVPENRLDRGLLSPYPRAAIGLAEVPPEQLLDRLGIWRLRGDMPLLPHEAIAALHDPSSWRPRPVGHWAFPQPISRSTYDRHLLLLRWAEEHWPGSPKLRPRHKVKPTQLPLPLFDRELEVTG